MNSYLLNFIAQFLISTLIYLFLGTRKARKLIKSKKIYKKTVFAVLILQILFIASLTKEVGDVMLFSGAGWWFRHKVDFYFIDQGHTQYPFFPFLIFFHAFANWLTEKIPFFTFSFYLKLFLLLPSLYYIGSIIFITHKKRSIVNAKLLKLQFLTSPITYAIVLFHGQVDVALLALFIASTSILFSKFKNLENLFLSATLYAASIATKTWSILLFPLLMKFQKNLVKTFILAAITALFLLTDVFIYTRIVDGSSISTVLPAIAAPGGPIGVWGLSLLLSPLSKILSISISYKLFLFFTLFLICELAILIKEFTFPQSCFLTILAIYIIIPNWGIQYLFWLLPFLFLTKNSLKTKNINLFYILSVPYIFINYFNIALGKNLIPQILVNLCGFLLWSFIVFWFYSSIKVKTKNIPVITHK